MPPILHEDKKVKQFADWRIESINKIHELAKQIAKDMNMVLFETCITKLVTHWLFYENFEKKVTQATIKCNPYRQAVDYILVHS